MFSRSNENSSNNLCFNICYAQMELRSICILLTCECFKNSRFGEVRGLGGGGVSGSLWRIQNLPIRTGNPGGSFMDTNSFNLLKCLNGAMTSSTFNTLQWGRYPGQSLSCIHLTLDNSNPSRITRTPIVLHSATSKKNLETFLSNAYNERYQFPSPKTLVTVHIFCLSFKSMYLILYMCTIFRF